MSRLLTFDQAKRDIGISAAALMTAIERGDLVQVDLEGLRGATRRYVTADSVDAWIDRLNDREPEPDSSDLEQSTQLQISTLGYVLKELSEKVDLAIGRMDNQQGRDRRTRLRHTVSSRIGDSFDPHGYYVYLLWGDDSDTPLYIGQSRNVLGRLGDHMRNAERRYLVRSVQLIKCSGERTMKRTEAALIREYGPPMNVVGTLNIGPTNRKNYHQ
jgi:predicted GIY-YIG superfamily endonuclease